MRKVLVIFLVVIMSSLALSQVNRVIPLTEQRGNVESYLHLWMNDTTSTAGFLHSIIQNRAPGGLTVAYVRNGVAGKGDTTEAVDVRGFKQIWLNTIELGDTVNIQIYQQVSPDLSVWTTQTLLDSVKGTNTPARVPTILQSKDITATVAGFPYIRFVNLISGVGGIGDSLRYSQFVTLKKY